jgi:hypothetical protein
VDNQNSNGVSIANLISMLGGLPGEKGVPSENSLYKNNVIPAEGSTFNRTKRVSPILSSIETTRVYNIGTALAKALYDFNLKRSIDTKQQTIVSQAKANMISKNKLQPNNQSKDLGGLGLLALTLAGIAGVSTLIYKYLGPIGQFITKFIVKLPGVLKSFKTFKELLQVKLISILDDLKMTKLGQKFTAITSNLKLGSFGKMITGIGEAIGKRLGFIFKRLPLIGALMSFTFAYSRWKEGKYITSVLEMLSGIANLTVLGGFLPGAAISLAIDGVILLADLISANSTVGVRGIKAGVKIGQHLLIKALNKISLETGKKLLKVFKWLPFIGGVAGLSLAYMRFKAGDWLAGTIELVAAIADFIPGGSIVSWILDGGLLLYDLLKTNKKESPSVNAKSSGSFSELASKFGDKLKSVLWYVPGISGLMYLGRGLSKIFSGNIIDGIKDIGKSVIGVVGGKGLVDFLSWTLGLLTSSKQTTPELESKKISFADIVSSMITGVLESIKNLYTNTINTAKDIIDNSSKAISNFTSKASYGTNLGFIAAEGLINSVIGDTSSDVPAGYKQTSGYRFDPGAGIQNLLDLFSSNDVSITKPQTSLPVAAENKELSSQTQLIEKQNQLLVQLVVASKDQLNVMKKQPAPVNITPGSSTSNFNMNNGFSTNRQDGRSMYNSSPYSISPSFA